MNIVFTLLVNFGLVLIHTSILPFIHSNSLINVVTLFVIYLSLFSSFREGLLNVLVSGLLSDSLSGGPFGIYVTIYFWLFVGINWITQYLHAKNLILLLVFIVVGVLFEHFISIGVAFIIHKNLTFTLFAINVAKRQILWSLVAGPLLVFGLSLMHQRWMQWVEFVHEKRSE